MFPRGISEIRNYWQVEANSNETLRSRSNCYAQDIPKDPYKCVSLRNSGKWLKQHSDFYESDLPQRYNATEVFKSWVWQPDGCMLHEYRAKEIENCLQCRRMLFIGDSAVRQLFWAVARKLDQEKAEQYIQQTDRHQNQRFNQGCMDLEYIWDPYLNGSLLHHELDRLPKLHSSAAKNGSHPPEIAVIIIGGGLWHVRNLSDRGLEAFKTSLNAIINLISVPSSDSVLVAPVPVPIQQKLSPSRALTLTPRRIALMNQYLSNTSTATGINVLWSFTKMTWHRPLAYEENGIHVIHSVAAKQADVVLNLRCNPEPRLQRYPFDKTCCARLIPSAFRALLLSIVSLVGFISVAFLVFGTLRERFVFSFQTNRQGLNAQKIRNGVTPTFALAILAAAVLYCFIADRLPGYDKVSKTSQPKYFVWMLGTVSIIGLISIRRSGPKGLGTSEKLFRPTPLNLLNREQTDELKGWMQAVILAYHYTGMSQTLWVYRIIRVLIAAYLFLTGFGHTMYFLERRDFSLYRVASVLVRLNMLSCVLPYVMQTSYDFYYFSGLSSLCFLMTYATVRTYFTYDVNHFVLKAFISALITSKLIFIPPVIRLVAKSLAQTFNIELSSHELLFRVTLDCYIVYVGMIFAMLYYKIYHSQHSGRFITLFRRFAPVIQLLAVLLALAILPAYFYFIRRFQYKFAYNAWHPIISPLPVLAYLVLRNATQTLRNYHSTAFAWLGRISLETFILQYHIWLAADTRGLLSLGLWNRIPNQGTIERIAEFTIITTIFLYTSWQVSRATSTLTRVILGPPPPIPTAGANYPRQNSDLPEHHSVLNSELKHPQQQSRQARPWWSPKFNGTTLPAVAEHQATTNKSTLLKRLGIILGVMWVLNWVRDASSLSSH
ncbi:MAG: hypothetical protein Q9227_008219 [Pyrenula ochraceoflavens]